MSSVIVGMMMSVIVSTVMLPVMIMPVNIIPFTVAAKMFLMSAVMIISFIKMPVRMSAKFMVPAFSAIRKRNTGAHKQNSRRQYDDFSNLCLHRFSPLEFEGLTY